MHQQDKVGGVPRATVQGVLLLSFSAASLIHSLLMVKMQDPTTLTQTRLPRCSNICFDQELALDHNKREFLPEHQSICDSEHLDRKECTTKGHLVADVPITVYSLCSEPFAQHIDLSIARVHISCVPSSPNSSCRIAPQSSQCQTEAVKT